MKDTMTNERLTVETDGGAGSYIDLPLSQVDDVIRVLVKNRISFEVEDEVISIDGEPDVATINLGWKEDPDKIQRLLDGIP